MTPNAMTVTSKTQTRSENEVDSNLFRSNLSLVRYIVNEVALPNLNAGSDVLMSEASSEMDQLNYSGFSQMNNSGFGMVRSDQNCCHEFELPPDMRFNDSHVITICAYACLMVVSAVGNISVLRSLAKPRMRTAQSRVSLMILHLAIADLLVTFLLMPLEIGWAWTVSWTAGDVTCRLMAFFRTFGIFLSGFLLVVISVDRYHTVLNPLTVTEAKKRVLRMLWIAWILSAVCSFPQAVIFHVERHPQFTWFEQCVTFNSFPSLEMELAYNVGGFIVMYAIPLVTIAFCYGSIVFALYRSVGKRQTPSLDRTKTKTLNMTLTIVLAFFFCWTPYNIMSLWYFIDRESAQLVDRRIQAFLFIFAVANSTVNPIVYGYFNCRRVNKDFGKSQWRMRRIVFKPPFRNHLCNCAPVWSSSSDPPIGRVCQYSLRNQYSPQNKPIQSIRTQLHQLQTGTTKPQCLQYHCPSAHLYTNNVPSCPLTNFDQQNNTFYLAMKSSQMKTKDQSVF